MDFDLNLKIGDYLDLINLNETISIKLDCNIEYWNKDLYECTVLDENSL